MQYPTYDWKGCVNRTDGYLIFGSTALAAITGATAAGYLDGQSYNAFMTTAGLSLKFGCLLSGVRAVGELFSS